MYERFKASLTVKSKRLRKRRTINLNERRKILINEEMKRLKETVYGKADDLGIL